MANVSSDEEKKNKALYWQNAEILRTIFDKCKYESLHGLQRPLELYKERVLFYTGTSEHVLDEILEERNPLLQLDLFDRAVINDALKNMYSQLKSFSFNEIYEMIQNKVKVPEKNRFCHIMRLFGYKPVNTLNYGPIVLEDPKLTFERFRYLNKIKKFRDFPKTIYYIDERVIDLYKTFKKPWIQNKDMSKIDGYVYYHIVSRNGLEKGLFCNQINEEDFTKWISDIVLSFIKASSVIIMDNNPLHGITENGPISMHNSKNDMLKWLQRYNIPCSQNMRKAELYDLITKCPIKEHQNKIDLIFKSHGHEVLRLPENYHDLSLTELLWEHIRSSSFTTADSANMLNLKNKVYNEISSIPQDKWSQFESTIKDTEKNIFFIDEAIEQALDMYEIDPEDNTN